MSTPTTPAGLLASMLIYGTRNADEKVTFKMLPLTSECPYAEVEFDASSGALAVISRHQRPMPNFLEKLDDKGRRIKVGTNEEGEVLTAKRAVIADSPYEYYLRDARDIEQFMALTAFNLDHPVYQYFLQASKAQQAQEQAAAETAQQPA
jgi:hypothetical protein